MKDWTAWREGVRQLDLLAYWRERGHLDDATWSRARALVDAGPAGAPWRGALEQLCLWLSVVLLGAAVICLIAANWDALDRFARLYGVQALLIAAALAAWRLGLERPAGQAALLLAGLLLGGLLALVGQTWQTGADTWQLFAAWAVLLLPWLLVALSPAMNLLWALVANMALLLLMREWAAGSYTVWVVIGLFNIVLAMLWDWLGRRIPSLSGRLGPRLLVAAALSSLTLATLAELLGATGDTVGLGAMCWLAVVAGCAVLAFRRRDLPSLSLAAMSVIAVLTTALARLLFDGMDLAGGGLLIMVLAVLGQIGFAGDRLRRLATEWADERL